jgi:hypothetical protein
MDKKLIWLIIGCVGILVVGVVLIGSLGGGLDRGVRERAEAELKNFSEAETQFASARKEVEDALVRYPLLFKVTETDQSYSTRFDAAAEGLQNAEPTRDKLQALLDENDKETRVEVGEAINELQVARLDASKEASEMQEDIRKLLEFQRELATKLPQLEADYEAIQQFDTSAIDELTERAVADWPEKQVDLNRRVGLFKISIKDASDRWTYTEAQRERAKKGEATGADVVALMKTATRIHQIRESLASAEIQMRELIDQLYWSWDKMLVDMEIQEGAEVGFRQKFQVVRTRVVIVPEGQEDEAEPTEMRRDDAMWKTVDKATYESMKDKLGMSVQHKPAGKFDHEATSLIQPPGYAHMCPVEQRRNHYGYWRQRGTVYHWYYYRPYYPMRTWLWGPTYIPVTGRTYNDYDAHRRSGRTYYGRDAAGRPLHGSSGSITKKTYASSRYVTTNGFRNTQYVKSGGTYRGSRYAKPAATARQTTTARSSGSRSGTTYRSSSYRSSSYSSRSGSRSSFGGK